MKKSYKSIISFLITFLMVLSSFNVAILKDSKVFATENSKNGVKVKVRIEANNRTIVPEKEIEVDNFDLKPYGSADNKDNIKAVHAIIKALESEKIDCKDENKFNSRGCTYLENIDGVKERSVSGNDGWMYYINNKYVNDYIGNAEIQDKDSIVVFFQEDYEKNTYSWFDQSFIKVKVGENINLKLLGLKKDVNTDEAKEVNIDDAKILVDNKDYIVNGKYVNTDKEGNVTLNFDKEGTYEVSAVRFNKDTKRRDISRPYCKLVVEKGQVKVDKTSLINSINEGEKILNSANIGSGVGDYPQESRDLLQKSIDEAKGVLNKEGLTVDELNNANIKLQNAILKFKESINKDESLQNVIDDIVSHYNTWKDNNFKSLDFITSMALRRAGVDTDDLFKKVNIYNTDDIHNNARNVMNIIGIGKNPRDYKGKDYTKFLISYDYDKESNPEYIAKAIIAMDMAEVQYDKEKIIGNLLSKANDEGDEKISFGVITPGGYDDFTGEDTEDEYTPHADVSAWSLIALSNHKDIKNSSKVIEGIKNYLKSVQDKNGLIDSSSDTALVIQGLIALGEDPKADYWCVKNKDKKVSMVDGILKCKKGNQFMSKPNDSMVSDIANSHVLAVLVDLNTMTSMYRKLKYEDVSVPVKVQVYGEKEVYNGAKFNLEAKAFNYNNVVIKNAAISWKSSNENIATVKNGVVQALKEGEVKITAHITGSEGIKDTIKIKVIAPPKIDYSDKLNKEIEFLKEHYAACGSYEFLASPAAVFAGVDKEEVKNKIYRYTTNNTALLNVKTIIELLGVGLDPTHNNVNGKEINHVEVLEKSQVKDGENKGKFIINEGMDKSSIETQAYSIIALDLLDGKYDKELAVKALLAMLNDSNYKETDSSYKYIKTEAIAVTALAKHKDILGVENKINELIAFFKENQNEDGAFDMVAGSTFPNSPAATGAVVQALLANNIDPLSWQWTKNGNTILDGMLKSKFEGRNASTSGYCQGAGLGFENSEASYYALSTLVQMLNKKSIFSMIKDNIKNKTDEVIPKDYTSIVNESIDKVISKNLSLDNDWYAVELNKIGKEVSKDYLEKVTKEIVNAKGQLSNDTDYAKKVLGILAAKGDPTNIGGYNLVEKIYNGDLSQGLNAHVFALIALDSGKFDVPKESKWNREKLINTILDAQTKDNGWAFFGSVLDPDATGMVISALAPYYNDKKEVKEAIDKALVTLSNVQTEKGGFKSSGSENSNSTSMIIIALSSLNIDLTTDSRFIKNHNTAIDALMGYKTVDGTFGFKDNKYNPMATEQALRALVAYKNFKENKDSIYKFNFTPSVVKGKDIEIKNLTKEKEFKLNSEAKVTIQAINNTKESKNSTLIVGLFDKSGKLINYVMEKQIIESGKTVNLNGKIKLPQKGEYTVKAFIWDSLESMKPLSNVIEMKVVAKEEVVLPNELISGETNNSTNIVLKTRENLQGDYGDKKAFVIKGVKSNPIVTNVKINQNKLTLTLNKPIKKGEKVTVDYKPTGNRNLIYENKSEVKAFENYAINNTLKNITIMAYVDADNNVEKFMLSDVKEMQRGLSDDPNLNVVALVDRISDGNADALGEKFTDTRLYELGQNKATRISGGKQFPEITTSSNYEANMGDAHTLKKFISFCKNNYEADQYVLVILDHGAGTQGFCIDESNNNNIINIGQVSDVLTKDESVDLLAFEACLMGNAEVAYQFRPGNGSFEAKAMIASSPTMLAYGLKYDRIFRRLKYGGGTTGEDDYTLGGKELIYDPATVTLEQLGGIILEEQHDSMDKFDDQVLAYYDLNKVSNVKKNVDNLAKLLYKENKKNVINEIRGSYKKQPLIMHYINTLLDQGEWMAYPYFDLYDFAEKIYYNYNKEFSDEVRNAAKDVMKSVDNFIVYSYAGKKYTEWNFKEGRTGVSIFLPDGDRYWEQEKWYTPEKLEDKEHYGNLYWCIDGQDKEVNKVGNWFELLDSWYDKSNDKDGGVNHHQW